MPASRRRFLAGTAGIMTSSLASGIPPARADGFPARPLRLIVGYTPGAVTDFSARVIAEALGARLGQNMVVENRPGANSMIALTDVAKSPRDGYTLIYGLADATSLLAAEKPNIPYNIETDFTYIARLVEFSSTFSANAKLPVRSMTEFIAYAKANPGKIRYGTSGVGSAAHVAALLLQQQAGISMVHVPYRGAAPALTDLLAGFIDVGIMTPVLVRDHAKAGQLTMLATTSAVREPYVPDLPTMTESGFPGATLTDWFGLMGPAGLPADVVDRLGRAAADVMGDAGIQQRLIAVALRPAPLDSDAFRKLVLDQYRQWKVIAESQHITVE